MTSTISAIVQSMLHPSELVALVQYSLQDQGRKSSRSAPPSKLDEGHAQDTLTDCYHYLNKTSRSFASVIQSLHSGLRDAVCIFYLVLRGLDTIEDDMSIPVDRKVEIMKSLADHLFNTPSWTFAENGPHEKDRDLLVHFNVVIDQFLKLDRSFQLIIADICASMASGMADYCLRANQDDFCAGHRVVSLDDYDMYCHYVAGLVGHGLTRLFLASRLESSDVLASNQFDKANAMGLFLQKINITRDLADDFLNKRVFWPDHIWNVYVPSLPELFDPKNKYAHGRAALNHMLLNALMHVPDVLTYLNELTEPSVFRFCAIPQVMAIATLALLYNNPNVMHSNVKIRKGLAVQLIMNATNMPNIRDIFSLFVGETRDKAVAYQKELSKASSLTPSALQSAVKMTRLTVDQCDKILCLVSNNEQACSHSVSKFRHWAPYLSRFGFFSLVSIPLFSWFISHKLK